MLDTRTHYIPHFTRRQSDGREEAVCGRFITADQIAPAETLPTCWGCKVWVENLDVIAPEPRAQEQVA